jgi:hypothetical protein
MRVLFFGYFLLLCYLLKVNGRKKKALRFDDFSYYPCLVLFCVPYVFRQIKKEKKRQKKEQEQEEQEQNERHQYHVI